MKIESINSASEKRIQILLFHSFKQFNMRILDVLAPEMECLTIRENLIQKNTGNWKTGTLLRHTNI